MPSNAANPTVEDHLRDKPTASVALYRRFVEIVAALGPYTVSPSKTTVTFKGRRRGFAGARPTDRGLRCYFDLEHPVDDPRILRAVPYTKRLFTHHCDIGSEQEMDDTFVGWITEAYAVGQGEHLRH